MIHNLQGRIPYFRKTSLQDFWKHGFFHIFWLSHSVCCNFWACTCFAWLGHHWLSLPLMGSRSMDVRSFINVRTLSVLKLTHWTRRLYVIPSAETNSITSTR
jgi:hypothetical protein